MKTSVKYYRLTVGAQGQAKWAKVAWKFSTYDVTHKKKPHHPPKKLFFDCKLHGLAVPFEPLSGSVAHTGPEKFLFKAMYVSVFIQKYLKAAGRQSGEKKTWNTEIWQGIDIFVFSEKC